ncbi:hypothetical protein KKY_445 [Pelagibacterium halotolerans B2]|uniref:Uncharacterized protein n=1 Tax=Pelagibacterium halotolerans (strain DSM 22347 / JCM 15775 / CGMCC 1.7692 / B2) TaxID=1082931 RepID=G4RAC8_PELHB|nr:hypothetical protein KKY_445 [Pelagibacterium halotolerans B2]
MVKAVPSATPKKPAQLATTALVFAVISTYVPPRFRTAPPARHEVRVTMPS